MEHPTPNQTERTMRESDFIVSKTNSKGIITYCNRTFIEFAGYSEKELLQQPHNIIRHPDMPRAVFRLMWQTLQAKQEFFGYVKNMSKDGSFYWIFANVTPSFDSKGELLGYFSVRRKPKAEHIRIVSDLYRDMLKAERSCQSAKMGMDAGESILRQVLQGKDYHEFILSL
jgi:PAS domain S-box-containing protein